MAQPRTEFDWAIYRNATLAGLAVLIPIPILDWVFERWFRRRIPVAIARHHNRELPQESRKALETNNRNWLTTCLTLPLTATIWLIKRISQKILYVLTIKEASEKVSYYWHRAFLIDYMLRSGHLETAESAQVAQQAMEQVLEMTTSPLTQLARQVTSGTRHIFRTLTRARQGSEDEVLQQKKSEMGSHWSDFEPYLRSLAERYDETYRQIASGQQNLA
jgi:hypothetical protein